MLSIKINIFFIYYNNIDMSDSSNIAKLVYGLLVAIIIVTFILVVCLSAGVLPKSVVYTCPQPPMVSSMAGQYNTSSVDQTGVNINYQQRSDSVADAGDAMEQVRALMGLQSGQCNTRLQQARDIDPSYGSTSWRKTMFGANAQPGATLGASATTGATTGGTTGGTTGAATTSSMYGRHRGARGTLMDKLTVPPAISSWVVPGAYGTPDTYHMGRKRKEKIVNDDALQGTLYQLSDTAPMQ